MQDTAVRGGTKERVRGVVILRRELEDAHRRAVAAHDRAHRRSRPLQHDPAQRGAGIP